MKNIFGKNFKLKRGLEPECLNFNFSKIQKISKLENILYVLLFIFIIPSFAYYFNYLYFNNNFDIFLKKYKNQNSKMTLLKILYLILIALTDQISFFLIDIFFNKEKFFKHS